MEYTVVKEAFVRVVLELEKFRSLSYLDAFFSM